MRRLPDIVAWYVEMYGVFKTAQKVETTGEYRSLLEHPIEKW
jgi:hypothetical protein